jgi:hypothetical protein
MFVQEQPNPAPKQRGSTGPAEIAPAKQRNAQGHQGFAMRNFLFAVLVCTSFALAQQPNPVYRGNWTGTAGPAVIHGRWAGQADARNSNLAGGSWTLQGDRGETVMEGSWSARKLPRGWRGSWSARTAAGRSYSGSWTADAASLRGETFADLLQHTLPAEVMGTWRSGRFFGRWQLRASTAGK